MLPPFSKVLHDLRERAEMTQQKLAAGSGVPLSTIRGLEQGKRLPGLVVAYRLAKAMGVSLDALADCDECKEDEKPTKKQKGSAKQKR